MCSFFDPVPKVKTNYVSFFQIQTEYDKEVVSLQKKGYGMTDKPKHFKLYANYSEQTLI